jgi:peptidoglycan hydrolase-like protein with peptidoglycan-binding domain
VRIARARDLADSELWELSLGRSRARRRATELRFVPTGSRAKRLSLGTLAALTVGPASSLGEATAARRAAAFLPPTTTEHTVTLESGSTGAQVRQLQTALHIKTDGDFGPETEAAVYQYQATHGLPVDGVAGPKTTTALAGDAPTKKPTQRDAIAMVQAQLGVQVDGEFGPETYEAIKAFQASRNIGVDAVVGPQTWKALHLTGDETLNPPPSAIPQPKVIPAVVTSSSGGTEAGAEGAAPPGAAGEAVAQPAANDEVQQAEGEGGTASEAAPPQAAAPQEAPAQAAPEEAPSAPASGGEEHHSEEHSSGEGQEGSGSEGSSGTVRRVISAGNEIATRPYVYGGGHGSFQSNGYDCSGSVSYALHGAGLIHSPETSGELEHYGEAGPGKHITIYANSEHAYMEVNGRRYDTVALAEHGSRWSNSSGHDGGSFVARHPAGQ